MLVHGDFISALEFPEVPVVTNVIGVWLCTFCFISFVLSFHMNILTLVTSETDSFSVISTFLSVSFPICFVIATSFFLEFLTVFIDMDEHTEFLFSAEASIPVSTSFTSFWLNSFFFFLLFFCQYLYMLL